jgi:hypothetical protein
MCLADDIRNCQCSSVSLDATQRQQLAQRYTGCLCNACLMKVATISLQNDQPE